MRNALSIFDFLLRAAARGERTGLLTITGVEGSASRGVGTQMAVGQTGFAGSLSGGCIEAAIVTEARRVIAAGRAEKLRFGQGSPFIDIRLPCGGGMDVLVSPVLDLRPIEMAAAALRARQPTTLRLGLPEGIAAEPSEAGQHPFWRGEREFVVPHLPNLRLVIAGHGAETSALAHLALSFGAQTCVLSPDEAIVAASVHEGASGQVLKNLQPVAALRTDRYAAVVLLFHDHERETDLLLQALAGEAFFIGAMGSRATQARRLAALAAHGAAPADLARITGPIGLLPATRDPETLALSALTQIVERYRAVYTTDPPRSKQAPSNS